MHRGFSLEQQQHNIQIWKLNLKIKKKNRVRKLCVVYALQNHEIVKTFAFLVVVVLLDFEVNK